ncbi:hypothetical protein AB7044_11690, partial [Providencia stuartii]
VVPEGAQVALHQLSQQQQAGRVIRRGLPRGYQDYHYDVNGRLAKKVVHQHGYRPQEWRYQSFLKNRLRKPCRKLRLITLLLNMIRVLVRSLSVMLVKEKFGLII